MRFNNTTFAAAIFCCVMTFVWTGCDNAKKPAAGEPPKMTDKQVKLWEESAAKGDVYAQYELAKAYDDGAVVTANPTNAFTWYLKAAEGGYDKAQYHVGKAYEQGIGTVTNAAEAVKWYTKAAEQGHSNAQEKLGLMVWKGEGTQRNLVEARKWLALAAAQGEGKATKSLKKLDLSLTPPQIAEAKKLEAAFTPHKKFKKPDKSEK